MKHVLLLLSSRVTVRHLTKGVILTKLGDSFEFVQSSSIRKYCSLVGGAIRSEFTKEINPGLVTVQKNKHLHGVY